jgi:hypothetical protein
MLQTKICSRLLSYNYSLIRKKPDIKLLIKPKVKSKSAKPVDL